MRGSEITFHFLNVALLTAVLAPLILWRYRCAVLSGMQDRPGAPVPSAPATLAVRTVRTNVVDPAAWEARLRRRVFIAVVVATLPSAALLAALHLYLAGVPPTPSRLLGQMGVTASVAVPIYAVLMAVPFWSAGWLWLATMVTIAAALVPLSMLQAVLTGGQLGLDQAMRFVYFFELAAVTLCVPMLAGLATGARRVRGVAPIIFAGLLVFGLAPYFGMRLTQALAGTRAGSDLVLSFAGFDTGFILFALPIGLLAWWRLKALARGYEAKRFSDALLLARTWWLLIVVSTVVGLIAAYERLPLVVLSLTIGAASYLLFPILLARCLRWANPLQRRPPQRMLLLLRVFGYTSRTETLFDRIASRWRLFGPVTMIAAPDVTSRTVDPGDFLRFAVGNVGSSFVNSREDLDQRLAAFDAQPDPDGRYRVNEFCCRETTWQATVVELMQRADGVIMDVRGYTPQRQGCEFELRELAARLAGERVVLVVDETTDRASLEGSIGSRGAGGADSQMRIVSVEHGSVRETDVTFSALIRAAYMVA
jgi:hypothetical protein